MATTTDKIAYATTNTITITLNSLASSATAGRGSAAVDNTTNLYVDALVYVQVKTALTTIANDKAVYVYVYGSEDGTNYSGSSVENVGTDAAVTLDTNTNLGGPVVISIQATSTTYKKVFSIAQFFGGVMPRKWGVVIRNYCGSALTGTPGDHAVSYTGITYTNS